MKKEKVSVVIPYFNNDSTIVETINSIVNQTYKNIEIIIIDDGSRDDSFVKLAEIASNNNIKLLKQSNSGPSIARNLGAHNATGYYLLFIDADDSIDATYIEKCVTEFDNNSNLEIVYSKAKFFDDRNDEWNLPELKLPDFLINNCIFISAVIKRNTFIDLGSFDTNINFTEDWELWIRIVKKHGIQSVFKIQETLFFYRKRREKNSLTDTCDVDDNSEKCRLYIYNKHYDFYKENKLDLVTLVTSKDDNLKYKNKYYNVWYRKLFYNLKKSKS